MAYTGQDLIDYEENQYLPLRYYQQNITAPEIMGQTSGITSTAAAQPYVLPGPSTPGGDKGGGFGWFGNLDESNMKVFDKQVWGTTKPGGQKGWISQPVTGYMNVNSGQYQTKEGKNINHLGLEVPSIIGMIGNKLTGKKWGEQQVGDTKGYFTKDKVDEDQAIFDRIVRRQKINAMRKDGIYKQIRPHADGQGISTVDTTTVAPQHHGDVSQGPGGGGGGGHQAKNIRDIKDEGPGVTASSGMHGGRHYAQGGRIGYNRGRVVNPGGYAGDEDGGIFKWIKSKIGSESETNPTVFGTQNSLLNQGSIAQLQNAIESYEALMHMGDLDEEQQADYELKLNQLAALTEGATQKAHGGRVPFFYGGIATAL